jgi:hypothetical protein
MAFPVETGQEHLVREHAPAPRPQTTSGGNSYIILPRKNVPDNNFVNKAHTCNSYNYNTGAWNYIREDHKNSMK